jgi:hypothetical protein
MMPDRLPQWIEPHYDALRRWVALLRRAWPWFLLANFLLAMAVTSVEFLTICRALMNPPTLQPQLGVGALYGKLIACVCSAEWAVSMISLALVWAWALSTWLAWLTVRFLVDALFQLFSREPDSALRARSKYLRYFRLVLRWRLNLLVIAMLLAASVAFIEAQVWRTGVGRSIQTYFWLIVPAVPIVYSVVWAKFLSVRARRRNSAKLDEFLFSRLSLRRRFKNILDGLAFLALLGLILLPGLFLSLKTLDAKATVVAATASHYEAGWNQLVAAGYSAPDALFATSLPNPESLSKRISAFAYFVDYSTLPSYLVRFQHGMFLVITVATFFEIGFPAILRAILFSGYRRSLRSLVLAAVKSFLIVAGLQLVVQQAFFVDLSNPVGVGTLFSFLISFFLMRETIELRSAPMKN